MKEQRISVFFALLAAALYAVSVPLSKLLLEHLSPTMLAGFLYLGAGAGMGAVMALRREPAGDLLQKADLPFVIAMVALDIAAPIFLMNGIARTNSANVSLLNNFEIVATSLIALLVFREAISKRLWAAIALVVLSGMILGFEGGNAFVLNEGSFWVLAACLCWGVENNCTRTLSCRSSEQIVVVKGLGSGTGGILTALCLGEDFPAPLWLVLAMVLGFVSYGLSIHFYIQAQKHLGAAKTSAFYAVAPFLGVGFSFLFLREAPTEPFYFALAVMALATRFLIQDTLGATVHSHPHRHGATVHTHEHRHGALSPLHIHFHSQNHS